MALTKWKYSIIILSSAAEKDYINAAIEQNLDPGGGIYTLTIGLSSTGEDPPTHYWCYSKTTQAGADSLVGLAAMFPGSKAYIWANHGGNSVLESTFSESSNVYVGEITPQEVLEQNSLQVIEGVIE